MALNKKISMLISTFGILLLMISSVFAAELSDVSYRYAGTLTGNSGVQISLISQDPDPVEPGKYVTVRFKIVNTGNKATGDLFLKLRADFPFSFDTEDAKVVHVGSLLPNQDGNNAAIAKFTVRVDKLAVEGTSFVDLDYYTAANPKDISTISDVPINIKTLESILEISDITTTPESTPQGSKGTLTLTIKNMADSYIDNVRVSLGYIEAMATASSVNYRELPIAPISDTSEKVVEHLAPGTSSTLSFNFIVDPNSESKVYKLPITIKYYDSSSKNYTKQALIGIMVGDKPEITSRLAYADKMIPGESGRISIEFINKGLTNIKRAYVQLNENPGQYTVEDASNYYLGNIDKDDFLPATFHIKMADSAHGQVKLRLNLEYRDENNKLYTDQVELPLTVDEKKFTLDWTLIILSSIGVLILIIILMIAIRPKSRR